MGSADSIAQRFSSSDLGAMRQKISDLIIALNPTFASPTPSPTGSPSSLQGDIDGNGRVDIFDYNILVGNFGK